MDRFELMQQLRQPSEEKIVFLVLDGLGGLPKNGKTELECAFTPNMDRLAKHADTGLMTPVIPGITPGSGPGHLALFGYDPLHYQIGRGILSALGVNFPIQDGDLAARVNFATIDSGGNITDRRAGRIPDETNRKMCQKIRSLSLPGIQFFIETEKEHRAALIFRGGEFSENISETDPQQTGVPSYRVEPADQNELAKNTAHMVNEFIDKVKDTLKDEHPANMILLRGFALFRKIPLFKEIYGLKACAIAGYPMYRGLARLVGMEVLDVESGVKPEFEKLKQVWGKYDFYFTHIKYPDSFGEDGNFEKKVSIIEEVDRNINSILELNPDVLVITADHSTPCSYKAHSWHPVPVLLKSRWNRGADINIFGEKKLLKGSLGMVNSIDLMSLVMAHSGRLAKFGA
ncbi:MAG: 2,3-bisphosphoglycerate-independent phosphoglycerate mutase [Spirochaetota bacterium]